MDGNAHDLVQTIPLPTTTSSVRVQCEAFDCGALLEIEVPFRQNSQAPLIVRCGNCQRLLEVWLNRGSRAVTSRTKILTNEPNSVSIKPTLDFQIKPANAFQSSGMSHQQLLKPPPLSRSHHPTKFNPFSFSGLPSTSHHPSFLTQDEANTRSIISGNIPPSSQFALRSMQGVESRIRKDRRSRNPSPYNRFMSREVKRIKAQNPDVDHRRAFRMAASNWARSPTSCQRPLAEAGSTQTSADQQSMSSVGEFNEVSPQPQGSSVANSKSSLHLRNGVATTKADLHPDLEGLNDQ